MRVVAMLVLVTIAAVGAQEPLALRIVSPRPDSYVSGATTLRAIVDPPERADRIAHVVFYADAKQVCRIEHPPYECVWEAPGIEEHQVRAVATLRNGRRLLANVRTKKFGHTERVDVHVIQVTATVTTGKGEFVKGLKREAFRIAEDGAPQRISYFGGEDVPLELVVAVDISGSMIDAVPQLKDSVRRFLGAVRQGDHVTFLGFNDNIFTLARREADPKVRMRAVDRLAAWGGTALYDAIAESLTQLGRRQGRKAVVVFSDGEDQSSHLSMDAIVRMVGENDATVFSVGQGRATRDGPLQKVLKRLADVSGGRAFFTQDINELDEAFKRILDELSHQYLMAYPPTNAKRDGTWRKISVNVAGKGYKVRARQGYFAVAPPPT
jgi:Ca-activated chloride channel family protein